MRAIKRAVRLAAQGADKTRAENTGGQRKKTDAQQGDDRGRNARKSNGLSFLLDVVAGLPVLAHLG